MWGAGIAEGACGGCYTAVSIKFEPWFGRFPPMHGRGVMYRYVRFAALFAALGLLLVPVVSATGTVSTRNGTAGNDARVMTTITGVELNDILNEAGYSGGKVDPDGDLFLKIEDRSVYFLIAANKDSIQAKAAWRTDDTSRPTGETLQPGSGGINPRSLGAPFQKRPRGPF